MQFCPALPQRAGAKHISFHEAAAKGDPALAPQTSPKTSYQRHAFICSISCIGRRNWLLKSSIPDVYCIVLYRFTVLYRSSSVVYPTCFDTPAYIYSVNDPK